MAEYVTTKDITIPKGTRLSYPAPLAKQAVTYGSAIIDTELQADVHGVQAHFQIPLDEALQVGLVEEAE